MFCQTCGQKLRSSAQFCNKCGKPVHERFGSALLPNVKAPTAKQREGHTAEQALDSALTAPELPKPPTDQFLQRGTDRQPLAKATIQDSTTPLGAPPGAITNVSAKLLKEPMAKVETGVVRTPQNTYDPVAKASTMVEEETIEEIAAINLSTEELQRGATGKPFFTRLLAPLTPHSSNPQHRRLARAVPLVILLMLVLLVFAYFFLK